MEQTPIITIQNFGENNAEFPMTEEQARIAARLLQVIYEGPSTSEYAALVAMLESVPA